MRYRWALLLAVLVALAMGVPPAGAQQRTVVLKVWTIGPDNPSITRFTNIQAAAERLNKDLSKEGAGIQIKVEGSFDTTNWDQYLRRALLAFQGSDAPDIFQVQGYLIPTWASGGFLATLDDVIPKYTQFGDIVPALWNAAKFKGKTYGIPQDTEARPLYFNKALLKRLGWTDQQVNELPARISRGDFTYDDIMNTMREARQKNIIEAGKGYYHRPFNGVDFVMWYRSFGGRDYDAASGKLVFTKEAGLRYYRWLKAGVDAGVIEKDRLNQDWPRFFAPISDGKVLFFSAGTWNWAELDQQYLKDKGGEAWLWANIGFAPQPSYRKGGKAITLSNPQVYTIAAGSKNRDLAVRLLAYTTAPDLDAKHAVGSGHLPVLRFTARAVNDRFLKEVSYLLNYTTFAPPHPDLPKWQDAFFRGVSAVESGQATPEQAIDVVTSEMQRTIGAQIIIE